MGDASLRRHTMADRERQDQDSNRSRAGSAGDVPRDMGADTARSKTIATPGGIPRKGDIGPHGAAEGEHDAPTPGSGAQRDAASGADKAFRPER
jgi:hypothetical protein